MKRLFIISLCLTGFISCATIEITNSCIWDPTMKEKVCYDDEGTEY